MANLIQYPVTFPFGATSAPYSPTDPHHGEDRACPTGTLAIVNSKQIGLTGNTGYSFGPHCHIDKNPSYPATRGYINPTGWYNITGTVVFAGLAESAGNMVVIRADNGYYYRFLHLSVINVRVGDRIQPMATDSLTKEEVIITYAGFFDCANSDVPQDFITAYTGKTLGGLLNHLKDDPSYLKHKDTINNPPGFEQLPYEVYKKKGD